MVLPDSGLGKHLRNSKDESWAGFYSEIWHSGEAGHTLIGNCCSSCPSAPRRGDTENLCLSPGPPQPAGRKDGGWGGDTASKGSVPPRSAHKCILVIQMRSGHNGGGPALNKEPLGITAERDEGPWSPPMNANASNPWEQPRWEQHRQGFVSRRLCIRKLPGMPSNPQLEKRPGGIHRPYPSPLATKSRKSCSQSSFFHPCSCNQTKTFLALLHPSAADASAHPPSSCHCQLCLATSVPGKASLLGPSLPILRHQSIPKPQVLPFIAMSPQQQQCKPSGQKLPAGTARSLTNQPVSRSTPSVFRLHMPAVLKSTA